jgi:hypothetical protein
MPDLAERPVEEARADGLELIGPGGLLGDLTKRVLEAGLEAELTDHLGYDRHDPAGRNGGRPRPGPRRSTGRPRRGDHDGNDRAVHPGGPGDRAVRVRPLQPSPGCQVAIDNSYIGHLRGRQGVQLTAIDVVTRPAS